MEYKILNLEEFQRNGPPQFIVLMRKYYELKIKEENKINISFQITPSLDKPEEAKNGSHIIEIIRKDKSLIKQVKRIRDEKIFSCRDQIRIIIKGEKKEAFIVEFKEDLRTCGVIDYELNYWEFEIDDILSSGFVDVGDDGEVCEEYDYEEDEEIQKEREEEGWVSV